jgi:hypothetical protein
MSHRHRTTSSSRTFTRRSRRIGPAVAVILGVAGPVVAPPSGAAADTSLTAAEAIRKYAPLVYLYGDRRDSGVVFEEYRPISAKGFLKQSTLWWEHDDGCDPTPNAQASIDKANGSNKRFAVRLGAGTYTASTNEPPTNGDGPCVPNNDLYRSNQYTRPYDDDRDNALGSSSEGFYLDLDDAARHGGDLDLYRHPVAPVYFQFKAGVYVTYWFAYGFNDPHAPVDVEYGKHEGDWENITVNLNGDNRATKVAFFHHGKSCTVQWKSPELQKCHGHPVVFSAHGSHGSYPSAKKWERNNLPDDHTGRGVRWRTYQHLKSLVHQPWYGYGGAWGQSDVNVLKDGNNTGPLGPSKFKNPLPDDWTNPC